MPGTDILSYTDKQLLWFKHYTNADSSLTYLNSTQSAKLAYQNDNREVARQNGVNNKKSMQPMLDKWLDEVGLSEAALKKQLLELTQANETKFVKIKGAVEEKELDASTRKVCTSGVVERDADGVVYGTGETLVAVDTKANETRRRALDMALKLKGMYAVTEVKFTGLEGLGARMARANERVKEPAGEDLENDDLFS